MATALPLGRKYRVLWTAAATSNMGDGIFESALPLLAASVTRDPVALSTVTVALTTPWLVFALVSGALADRWDRAALVWRVDLFRFVVTAALALVVVVGWTSIPLLVIFAIGLGAAETLFDSASLALVPDIVGTDADRLTRANARLEGADIVANQLAGPPAGAGLFVAAASLPAVVNAASFFGSALLLRRLPRTQSPRRTHAEEGLRRQIAIGVRWLVGQPMLRMLAAVVGVMNLATAAATATFVLFVQEELDAGTAGYALALTVAALGAVAGNVVADRKASRLPPEIVLPAAVALFALGLVAIGAFPALVVTTVGLAVVGVAGAYWNVVTVSMRQRVIPNELLGRVNSVYRLVAYGMIPLGAIGGGALAKASGLRAPFIAGGLLVLLAVPPLTRSLRRSAESYI